MNSWRCDDIEEAAYDLASIISTWRKVVVAHENVLTSFESPSALGHSQINLL
jgi:hypothetical protein